MTEGRSLPGEPSRIWAAGESTLLADSHTTEEGITYSKGATITLDERQATRLGNAGTIASPGGMQAVKARVEADKARGATSTSTGCGSLPGSGKAEQGLA